MSQATIARSAFHLKEFCRRNGLSKPLYYKLKAQGLGPREMRLGSTVRISAEEEAAWQRARSNPDEAERARNAEEEERLRQRARDAASKAPHVAAARDGGR